MPPDTKKKFSIILPKYEHRIKAIVINPRKCDTCGNVFKPTADKFRTTTCPNCEEPGND